MSKQNKKQQPKKEIKQEVKVLGPNKEFVSYTHPARARSLLAKGKAFIVSTINPFTIQLKGRVLEGDNSERKKTMVTKRKYVSFTELFKEEKDIWVQNVGKTQISLQFQTSPGTYVGKCLPRSRKPINLSQFVSFEAIKNSNDLKVILNRRPAKLLILTDEEAQAVFQSMAKANGTSMEEEMDIAFEEVTMLMDHIVPEISETTEAEHELEAMKRKAAGVIDDPIGNDPQDIVTPKVIGLLEQVGDDVPQGERMRVGDLKAELEVMAEDFTRADFKHLNMHAPASIKKWANQLQDNEKS